MRGFVELFLDKQRARHEAEQLRLLVHGTTDYAIFMLDPQGRVVTWNAGAERIKGYKADEIIGQHFSRFYPPEAIDRGWPAHELEGGGGGRPVRGRRLAGPQGRLTFLGQRRHHGAAGRAGRSAWLLKSHARPDRAQAGRRSPAPQRGAVPAAGRRRQGLCHLHARPGGHVASWNAGAERIKQYRAEEIIGQHFCRFYPQEAIDRGWPAHELEVAQAEGRFEDEGWRVRKDGSQFWANVVITALRDEAGNLLGFSKITRDMTERKQAEENARRLVEEAAARRVAEEDARLIQEQRERLHVTLASIGDAVISTDAEGRVDFLNPVAEELVGWTDEKAARQALPDVFHIVNEDTRQPVENPALRALAEGTIVGLANHTVLISRDGTERPIDDCAAPIRDAEGHIVGSVLVFRDITERRRSEEHFREQQEQLRHSEALPPACRRHAANRVDRATGRQIDYLNRRWTEFTGLPATVGNEGWGQILHPDDGPAANEALGGIVAERRAVRDGDAAPRSAAADLPLAPGPDRGRPRWTGKVARWFGTGTDIHEQKRAEESSRFLAEASAALAGVVDYESTLQKVANLAVPVFRRLVRRGCGERRRDLRRLAVAHQDSAQDPPGT